MAYLYNVLILLLFSVFSLAILSLLFVMFSILCLFRNDYKNIFRKAAISLHSSCPLLLQLNTKYCAAPSFTLFSAN